MAKLYKLPINFKELTSGKKDLDDSSLIDSIAANCTLIITSRFNSHRYDIDYGCIIWEKDFELLTTNTKWEEEMIESITNSVIKNERRLENINISTKYDEQIVQHPKTKVRYFRKNIQISINANIKSVGQPFFYKKILYLSPIELN